MVLIKEFRIVMPFTVEQYRKGASPLLGLEVLSSSFWFFASDLERKMTPAPVIASQQSILHPNLITIESINTMKGEGGLCFIFVGRGRISRRGCKQGATHVSRPTALD
jgi:hypothetical protein